MVKLFKAITLAIAFTVLGGVEAYAATTGTFTADAPKTVTASAVHTEGKTSEQYKLTISKGTGVSTVTTIPAMPADGFFDKDTVVKVTRATYNTGYEEDTGIGDIYVMDSAQTASVTAKKIIYNIIYKANGGTGGNLTNAKTHGTAYTILDNQFTKPTGKHFIKWNTKADGSGTNYSAGASYTTEADLILYAQWAYDTYAVTYNYNNPSGATNNGGTTSSQTKTYGTDLTLQANGFKIPTKTGGTYAFNGWNTKADGSGTAYAAKATYKTNTTLALYAQWKWTYTTYSVTYNYNCPSGYTDNGGLPSNQTKTYGTNLTLSSTKPNVPTKATSTTYTTEENNNIRQGYRYKTTYRATFKEWNTKADGSGTKYAAGATYTSNAAVTLYAIWTTSTGKTNQQYYLNVVPGSHVTKVTGEGWYSIGGTATVTATCEDGYKVYKGTGSHTMDSAKRVDVIAIKK